MRKKNPTAHIILLYTICIIHAGGIINISFALSIYIFGGENLVVYTHTQIYDIYRI